jgi:outer membrane protein W
MQLATLVLVTASLISPQPSPSRVTAADSADHAAAPPSAEQRDRRQQITNGPTERPHTVGLGASIGISTYGGGGSVRYWFGDRVGLNFDAAWTRPYQRTTTPQGTAISRGSVFQALPSMLVNLKKANQDADIDLVPYVGAGLHYINSSRPLTYTAPTLDQRTSGMGGQVFGGVEMSFKETPSLTISVEGIYYRLPVRVANARLIEGFNYLVAIHWYLK